VVVPSQRAGLFIRVLPLSDLLLLVRHLLLLVLLFDSSTRIHPSSDLFDCRSKLLPFFFLPLTSMLLLSIHLFWSVLFLAGLRFLVAADPEDVYPPGPFLQRLPTAPSS